MSGPVKLIETSRISDQRGWFSETYVERRWAEYGVDVKFVQDNESFSRQSGTIRGIHFQSPPHAQAKLVRCLQGKIIDFAVDLRDGSPTYGRFVEVELSAANGCQLFIPVGFGHAFITIEPDTAVSYKVSDYYAPDCERGISWNCPAVGISWPLPPSGAILSPKDQVLPSLAEFASPFTYDGVPLAPI